MLDTVSQSHLSPAVGLHKNYMFAGLEGDDSKLFCKEKRLNNLPLDRNWDSEQLVSPRTAEIFGLHKKWPRHGSFR